MKFNILQIAAQNNMQVIGLENHFESLKSDIIVSLTKSEVVVKKSNPPTISKDITAQTKEMNSKEIHNCPVILNELGELLYFF